MHACINAIYLFASKNIANYILPGLLSSLQLYPSSISSACHCHAESMLGHTTSYPRSLFASNMRAVWQKHIVMHGCDINEHLQPSGQCSVQPQISLHQVGQATAYEWNRLTVSHARQQAYNLLGTIRYGGLRKRITGS